MDAETVGKVLRSVPLFKSLRPNDITRIAGLASVRPYRGGSTIVHQDDTAVTMYCVLSGRVRVQRETPSGDGIPLAELGPGGFFGEMSLLDEFPRSASVV